MQDMVTVLHSRQFAILLIGIALTFVGFSAIGYGVTGIMIELLMKILNVDDLRSLQPFNYFLLTISSPLLLGTAIVLYGISMMLFKAPVLSVKSLIFGLVSVAYLASWAAFLWWMAPLGRMGH